MDASGILLAPVVAGDPGQRVLISSAGPDPVPEVDGASPSRLFSAPGAKTSCRERKEDASSVPHP